jgi:hypothetical protein
VRQELAAQIRQLHTRFEQLLSQDVAKFNDALKQRGMPAITVNPAR